MIDDKNIDGVWTPKLVGETLVDAVKWAEKSAGRVGPSGYGSGMPELQMLVGDRIAEEWPSLKELNDGPKKKNRNYTPKQISLFEKAITWQSTYLEQGTSSTHALRCWLFCKATKRRKFSDMASLLKTSRQHLYRQRDIGLSKIAQGLSKDGVIRP